ncbi:MAG: succinate dehydrogenase iron-sulfur subunit [Syntrophobacteraceae bacterium]|jgi:succinate dehydrogenase / fumarate reductase iron-sulfur subunit|nr:succinate dehydrogenase iron-sulfur subunit [Syntrophobacteraceae bacterium]
MEMHFKIFRFDPETDREPYYRDYVVATEPRERILDCLNRIKWEQDGTLGYRMSCAHGVCGSDGMRINGVCGLACQKLVKDYQGSEILLEPLPHFRILKDLVVDMEEFLDRVKAMQPYLLASTPPPERERLQGPEERRKVEDVIRCILCGSCTGACPAMDENPEYVGPAALVWAYRYLFDSRDGQYTERLKAADHPNAVWSCKNYFECTRVCPKGIPVTKSINLMKREINKVFGEKGPSS